jgi:hypothetical protein
MGPDFFMACFSLMDGVTAGLLAGRSPATVRDRFSGGAGEVCRYQDRRVNRERAGSACAEAGVKDT